MTALQADNEHTTHSLTVSWERPPGLYDAFRLQLLEQEGPLLANHTLPASSRRWQLGGLVAGRRYRVKVVTLSAGVQSAEVTAEGQTRE